VIALTVAPERYRSSRSDNRFPVVFATSTAKAPSRISVRFAKSNASSALLSGCALAFGALAVMRCRWEADG
jgi:hypothetical protein